MSAFYERTDSRPKGGFIALIGLIVTVVTAVIAFLLIQKKGAPGFAALLLPMGSLIVAGIALRRAKEGVKKGYVLSSDGIEEIIGENHVIVPFQNIRKTRRILDSRGFSLYLVLYPKTGSPMRVTQLSGPDAAAIDSFVESSIPADVERVLIRETRAAGAFRKCAPIALFILLYAGPNMIHTVLGLKSGPYAFIDYFLMILTAMAWACLMPGDFRRDDYTGKLSVPRMLVLFVMIIAYLALVSWHSAFTPISV